jgi:hypothetical protein
MNRWIQVFVGVQALACLLILSSCALEVQHERDNIAFRLPDAVALACATDPMARGLFTEISAQCRNELDGEFLANAIEQQWYDEAHPNTNAAVSLWVNVFTLAYARHGTKSADTFALVEQIANAIDAGRKGHEMSTQPEHL